MIPELDRNAPAGGARSARSGLDRVRLSHGKIASGQRYVRDRFGRRSGREGVLPAL